MESPYDAIVVGGGPVGSVTALQLARAGMRVALVEEKRQAYPYPRALSVDSFSVAMIRAALGVEAEQVAFERCLAAGYYADMHRWSQGEPFVTTDSSDDDWRLFFDQTELEAMLWRVLTKHPQVNALFGTSAVNLWSAKDGTPRLVVREGATGKLRELQGGFVVGCDGASSFVREQIGVRMESLGESGASLVVDAYAPMSVLYGARAAIYHVVDGRRPVMFALSGQKDRVRWEFRVDSADDALKLQAPERVRELIEPFVQPGRMESVRLVRHGVYRFQACLAPSWQSGRVFLCGDAAHGVPPFLGQGLSAGLRNAHNLCRKLTLVWSGAATDALLGKYEAECLPSTRALIADSLQIGRLLWEPSALASAVRGAGSALKVARGGLPVDLAYLFVPRAGVVPGSERLVHSSTLRAWRRARVRFGDPHPAVVRHLQLIHSLRPMLVAWREMPKAAALKLLSTLPRLARPQVVLAVGPDQTDRVLSLWSRHQEDIVTVMMDDWVDAVELFGSDAQPSTTLIVMGGGLCLGRYAHDQASKLVIDYLAALNIAGPVAF